MPNLTDCIEDYLKKLLALSMNNHIEVQRRELAQKFSCVPSQINYVLQRRFPQDRGYLVESRRGGGGCIRIYRIESGRVGPWKEIVSSVKNGSFEPARARQLIKRMYEEKIISQREARLLEKLTGDDIFKKQDLTGEQKRKIQQKLFVEAVEELFKLSY